MGRVSTHLLTTGAPFWMAATGDLEHLWTGCSAHRRRCWRGARFWTALDAHLRYGLLRSTITRCPC